MYAVTISVEGEAEKIDFPANDSYGILSKAVGGMIEAVSLTEDLDLWVNEEGLLINLPFNFVASAIAFDATGYPYRLMGNAIITGGYDDEGNTLPLSDELAQRIIDVVEAVNETP